ncbi:hypothetical protein OIU79_000078, partial [Salix purpurea]
MNKHAGKFIYPLLSCGNSFKVLSARRSLCQSLLQLPLPQASFSSTHQVGVQILPSLKQLQ